MVAEETHPRAKQLPKDKRKNLWDINNHISSLTADASFLVVSTASLSGVPESH